MLQYNGLHSFWTLEPNSSFGLYKKLHSSMISSFISCQIKYQNFLCPSVTWPSPNFTAFFLLLIFSFSSLVLKKKGGAEGRFSSSCGYQFSQHHLRRRLFCPHCVTWWPCQMSLCMCRSISGLFSVPFLCVCEKILLWLLFPMCSNFKSRNVMFPASFFSLLFLLFGGFCSSMWILEFLFSISMKNFIGIVRGVTLSLCTSHCVM